MSKDVLKFVREVKLEGQKVTWPTRKEVMVTTVIVAIMITLVSLFLLAADWAIAGVIELILGTGK
ncbi:MAG: preprotein translocase subunit SecE [Alphaproteobacteria bacterium]|nr:preprotein translocase subunit SecE [Alphaproteobacteria bacterium]